MLNHTSLGNLEAARQPASDLLVTAEPLRDRFWNTVALRSNEDIAHLRGDWTEARSFSDRGLAISPQEPRSLSTRMKMEYETGNLSAGEEYLERLINLMQRTRPGATLPHTFTTMLVPVVARVSDRADLLGLAESAAMSVFARPQRVVNAEYFSRTGLAMLASMRNDTDLAGEQYRFLTRYQGTLALFAMTSVDRVLGLLAQTMGNFEQAAAHLQAALAFCRNGGYWPELAWSCCDYADVLVAPGIGRDINGPVLEQAHSLLHEADSLAQRLG